MALNKGISHGKEHRRSYMGSKAISKTCRNHGSCPWCKENRTYKYMKKNQAILDKMKEFGYN